MQTWISSSVLEKVAVDLENRFANNTGVAVLMAKKGSEEATVWAIPITTYRKDAPPAIPQETMADIVQRNPEFDIVGTVTYFEKFPAKAFPPYCSIARPAFAIAVNKSREWMVVVDK